MNIEICWISSPLLQNSIFVILLMSKKFVMTLSEQYFPFYFHRRKQVRQAIVALTRTWSFAMKTWPQPQHWPQVWKYFLVCTQDDILRLGPLVFSRFPSYLLSDLRTTILVPFYIFLTRKNTWLKRLTFVDNFRYLNGKLFFLLPHQMIFSD